MPIQDYHLDLSTGACGAVLRSCCSNLFTLPYGSGTVCELIVSLSYCGVRGLSCGARAGPQYGVVLNNFRGRWGIILPFKRIALATGDWGGLVTLWV